VVDADEQKLRWPNRV